MTSTPDLGPRRPTGAHRRADEDVDGTAGALVSLGLVADPAEPAEPVGALEPVEPAVEGPPDAAPRARPRSRAMVVAVAASVLVLVLGVAGGIALARHKTVAVVSDGQAQEVGTMAATVQGVLDDAGITVGPHDTVAPAPDTAVADGAQIVIHRGRLLTLTVDGSTRQIWTTATTVEQALRDLGQDPGAYRLSADRTRSIPLDGLAVSADTLRTATVTVDGVSRQVTGTGTTIGQLLADAGIALAANQRVSPALTDPVGDGGTVTVTTLPTVTLTVGTDPASPIVTDQPTVRQVLAAAGVAPGPDDVVTPGLDDAVTDGLQVSLTRIAYTTETVTETVDQPADRTVRDDTLAEGVTTVSQIGRAGVVDVTYRTTVTNGTPGPREEVGRTVVTEARPTITRIGTKPAPAPAPAPSTQRGGTWARNSPARARMTIRPGTMNARPPTSAPSRPRTRQAQKIASWVEAGPGSRLQAATASSNSTAVSQRRRCTHSSRSIRMWVGGPPKPTQPIQPQERSTVARLGRTASVGSDARAPFMAPPAR